jgi:hypothetical protein
MNDQEPTIKPVHIPPLPRDPTPLETQNLLLGRILGCLEGIGATLSRLEERLDSMDGGMSRLDTALDGIKDILRNGR